MNTQLKDTRIAYANKKIYLQGNVVSFVGKGDPKTKVLKIYRMFGDVTLFGEAVQQFAIDHGYEKVLTPNYVY